MELKYKVWDKENNRMLLLSDEELGTVVLFDKIGVSVYLQDGTELSEFDVLPYTGVKDINKKECYLGDILKKPISKWLSEKQREKCEKEKHFLIVKNENDSNNMYLEYNFNIRGYWETNNLPITHIKEYEIVGSIYINPDMIKKEG